MGGRSPIASTAVGAGGPEENFRDRIYRDELVMLLRRTPEGWTARFDFVLTPA